MTVRREDVAPARRQTVYVVDDDPEVRDALDRLFRSFRVPVRTFASAEAFLSDAPSDPSGCLILDIRMPGVSGLDLQAALATWAYVPPIVFLTGHGTVSTSVRALKAGAADFLQKPVEEDALMAAVEAAFAQDREAHAAHAQQIAAQERLATLTPREREILHHVVAGKPNKQIAFELGKSEQTVKIHRGRVMQKTGIDSLPDLVRLAQLAGVEPATDGSTRA